jgi:hypothetical protein
MEFVGHTHEDVDQMFSRFSTALHRSTARTILDLNRILRGAYTPVPNVSMMDHTMNWDAYKETIGYGTLTGIAGEHAATQEEKLHYFKITKRQGRAILQYKRLAGDALWFPEAGIDLLRSFDFPWEMPTKHIKRASPELIVKLRDTFARLKATYSGEKVQELHDSWTTIIDWMEQDHPPVVSPTWAEFIRVFNITPQRVMESMPLYVPEDGPLSHDERQARRESMTGISPDVDTERIRQRELRGGAGQETMEVEVAVPINAAMGIGQRKARVRVIDVSVGMMCAVLTYDTERDIAAWWPAKILSLIDDDTVEVHYWGGNNNSHSGTLHALLPRDNIESIVMHVNLEMLSSVKIILSSSNRINKATRTAILSEVANFKAIEDRKKEQAAARALRK